MDARRLLDPTTTEEDLKAQIYRLTHFGAAEPRKDEAARKGDDWLSANLQAICRVVCSNESVKAAATGETTSDLLLVLVGALGALYGHELATNVGALLARGLLRRVCRHEWDTPQKANKP